MCYTHSGTQFGFADIVNTYLPQNITGVLWDDVYVSPYFSWKVCIVCLIYILTRLSVTKICCSRVRNII